MLILTRRVGESIMIGDDISITTLGVKGNQVRIGINAPEGVSVHREEIYKKILLDIASSNDAGTIQERMLMARKSHSGIFSKNSILRKPKPKNTMQDLDDAA